MAAQRNKADSGEQPATDALRRIPAVDRLVEHAEVAAWAASGGYDRSFVARAVGVLLDDIRAAVLAGELDAGGVDERLDAVAAGVAEAGSRLAAPYLRHVINATGVVIHTNLGRAPWPVAAAARTAELASGYLNLEFDLVSGGRGQRGEALERMVGNLLPGVAVAVVNNCAAAVLLVLNTVAEDKEVIVSRGQLVEIGGSFRIPEVMSKSQSILREVGTTNRTRIADFEAAINDNTGALLSVHPSNYRVVGFTATAGLAELAALGAQRGIPVVEDLGGGSLIDLAELGIADEPGVKERLATGVDLVTFSGDKLLGGPQAGFIVGKPEFVEKVRRNPLYRALRLDKATTLALEATLGAYITGNENDIPVVRMLRTPAAELRQRADALLTALQAATDGVSAEVVAVASQVGGGAAPGRDLPSFAIALEAGQGADHLMARLRGAAPPVIGRIVDDRVLLDVRTLLPDEGDAFVDAVAQALS